MPTKRYTGSVYKRKDSPYYWGSVMVKGERFQRPFSTNKAVSLEEYRKWRKEIKQTRNGKSWAWFKKWFIENKLSGKQPATIYRYKLAFKEADRIIKPKYLWDFNQTALANYRTALKENAEKNGFGYVGPNKMMICLKSALAEAMKNDFAFNLKIHILESFTVNTKPLHTYEIWQLAIIKRYASAVHKAQVFLFCRAGLRPEEGRNLLKTRISWENKSGILDFQNESKNIAAWGPKMGHIRHFTLEDPELWAALKELPTTKSPYLLTNRYGEAFSDQGQINSWKKELKRINNILEEIWKNKNRAAEKVALLKILPAEFQNKVPKLTGNLKDFRKTFATQLEDCEQVKNEDISFLLGHRPKGVTDAHYFVKKFEKKRHIVKYLPKIP